MGNDKTDDTGFKAGVVAGLGPICGVVWGIPPALDIVWLAAVLKILVSVLGLGLSGMFVHLCSDFYKLRLKPKIFKDEGRQKDKAA